MGLKGMDQIEMAWIHVGQIGLKEVDFGMGLMGLRQMDSVTKTTKLVDHIGI